MSDPLSDVLRTVRLAGGVFLDAYFTEPWGVYSKVTPEECAPFMPSAAQIISYHYVIDGRLELSVDGAPPVEVGKGEIVLLPRNDIHLLASGPGVKPIDADGLTEPSPNGGLTRLVIEGGGDATHIICGYLGTEEEYNPLIAALPKVLKIDIRQGASRDMVEASIRFAANELAEGRLASSAVMLRLSELLFVEAVRHHAQSEGKDETGWLNGLKDPQIGRALALMHQDLAKPWSAEDLARAAAMSRSAFVDRFTSIVGVPPIRYLTVWRMQAARLQLRETAKSIAQIAHSIGYESEEAFSRAFKREFALPPARWREAQLGA
jgi:AraC-like DNA-binding protein